MNQEAMLEFENALTPAEKKLMDALTRPGKIQEHLNTVPYSEDHFYRCPLRMLRDNKGHCFDGALFAALALRRLGFKPTIVELIPNERDDDHILAVFKQEGRWGAVAQSNFTGLRYRDPVFRSVRELVMSYWADFFNAAGEMTLRGYRGPINLAVFDRLQWMSRDTGLEALAEGMDRYRITPVISEGMVPTLENADERSLRAGLLGAKAEGLFEIPGQSAEARQALTRGIDRGKRGDYKASN